MLHVGSFQSEIFRKHEFNLQNMEELIVQRCSFFHNASCARASLVAAAPHVKRRQDATGPSVGSCSLLLALAVAVAVPVAVAVGVVVGAVVVVAVVVVVVVVVVVKVK